MDNLDTLTIGVKFDAKEFANSAQQIESIVNKLTNKLYEQFNTTFELIGDGFKEISKDLISITDKKINVQLDNKKFTQSLTNINNNLNKLVVSVDNIFQRMAGNVTKSTNIINTSITNVKNNINSINKKQIKIKINTQNILNANQTITNSSMQTIKNIGGAFDRLFTGIGLGFSFRTGVNFLTGMNKLGSQIQFIGSISNTNTTKLQEYRQAIDALGGSSEEVTGQIQSLYSKLSEAGISGNPELSKWLGGLGSGIKTRDANNNLINTDKVIDRILEEIHALEKDQRLPALNKFGLPALLPLANFSNKERKEKLESFKSSSLTESQVEQARAEQEKWTKVSQKWQKIGADINTIILPVIDHLADVILKLPDILSIIGSGFKDVFSGKAFKKDELGIGGRFVKEAENAKNNTMFGTSFKNFFKSNDLSKINNKPKIYEKNELPTFNQQNLDKFDRENPTNNMIIPPIIPPHSSINHNQHINTQQHNQNVSLNIQNLNLPEATNPKEFAQSITKMSQTGWGFSGSRMA